MQTKDISRTGLLISLAMIFSYIETLIPTFVAIPGLKVGLANIVIVFALYKMGFKYALIISLLRVFLVSVLFGSVLSLAYSFAGALVSLSCMALLKKTDLFSTTAVSVAGAVLHNMAQIATAYVVMNTSAVAYYIPFLLIFGVASGIVVGTVGSIVIKRVKV